MSQLCGNCGRGIAAVLPSGDVCPCVMARWLTAGNVRDMPLATILSGPALAAATAVIPARSRRAGNPETASRPARLPATATSARPRRIGLRACERRQQSCPPQGGTVLYAIGSRGESA